MEGFTPSNPYKPIAPANFIQATPRLPWPTLSELNDELDGALLESDPDARKWHAMELVEGVAPTFSAGVAPGPPPAAPSVTIPTIPSLEALNVHMFHSSDNLFFIAVPI